MRALPRLGRWGMWGVLALAGCGPTWQFDYQQAYRQGRSEDRDVLFYYKDPLDPASGRMRDVIESSTVAPLIKDRIRCLLVPSYSPNRKFVAQYGIDQPPALIVVHPDGTYHSLAGEQPAERVRTFLESARPPGARPNLDVALPLRSTFQYFNIYERAVETARRQNRRLLIVYKWWLQADSTELIRRISRPDVARYYAEDVKCILDWDHVPNRQHVAAYGVGNFPALILVETDGSYRTLQGLPSVEQIVGLSVAGQDTAVRSGGRVKRPDQDSAP